MKKYNLDELKKIDKNYIFPEDVNSDAYETAENIEKTFKVKIDIELMKMYEKPGNKFYGPFFAIGDDGKLYGKFHFVYGVCCMWDLIRHSKICGSQAHVQRFNRNVYKGKNKITHDGENGDKQTLTQSEENNVG